MEQGKSFLVWESALPAYGLFFLCCYVRVGVEKVLIFGWVPSWERRYINSSNLVRRGLHVERVGLVVHSDATGPGRGPPRFPSPFLKR